MNQKQVTIIVKVTNSCNLACLHCYNSPKSYSKEFISFNIIKDLIRKSMENYESIKYIWHGGEPMLVGVDFYIKIIEFQKQFSDKYKCKYKNAIQTNATLIDQEYIDFFIDNDFSVGVSYDGKGNSILRQETELVESNIDLMLGSKLKFGILSTVCNQTIVDLNENYELFNKRGLNWKFNTVFSSGSAEKNDYILVENDKYVTHFMSLFKKWLFDEKCIIEVDTLENYVKLLLRQKNVECVYNSCLTKFISIDVDGTLYPCGRYYPSDYKLINIKDVNSINEAFTSKPFEKLITQSIERRNKCLDNCDYYEYCQGGCNNNFLVDGGITHNNNNWCKIFKSIMDQAKDILSGIDAADFDKLNPKIKNVIIENINYL